MSPPVFNCFRNSIIPEPVGFMLYFCQKLLNFQGTQALIQVRSLSYITLKSNGHYRMSLWNKEMNFKRAADDKYISMVQLWISIRIVA